MTEVIKTPSLTPRVFLTFQYRLRVRRESRLKINSMLSIIKNNVVPTGVRNIKEIT